MSNNQDLYPVIMGLSGETYEKVTFICDELGVTNKTDAVARAIRLACSILQEIKEGARIELHRSNGDVRELLIK